MKKSLLALAALSAFAGAASAQSSVTFFGVVDLSARSVKNGSAGTVKSVTSGGLDTSRWGIRGVEDLGGGTTAGFWLESGINADTGANANAQTFGRRSTVSLANSALGEVRLGRDVLPTRSLLVAADPFGATGLGNAQQFESRASAVVGSTATDTSRASNSVQYILPGNLGGVNGALFVSAGEGGTPAIASPGNTQKTIGGRLGYAAGPVSVAGGYLVTKNTPTANLKDTTLTASYDFGFAKFSVANRTFKWSTEKLSETLFGVVAPVGPGRVRASILKGNQTGATAAVTARDATQLALGYVYDLSKRTALYADVARLSNKGTATFVLDSNPAGILGGQRSSGFDFGIRHSF